MSFTGRLCSVIQNILNSPLSSFPHRCINTFSPLAILYLTETNADTYMKKSWTEWEMFVCKHVWETGTGTKARLRLLAWLKDSLARCLHFSQLKTTGSRMPSGDWTWEWLRGRSSVTSRILQITVCSQGLQNRCGKGVLKSYHCIRQINIQPSRFINPVFVKLPKCVREMLIQVYGNFRGCS